MTIVIKVFKGAIHADRHNNRFRAKTTFLIRQTPHGESYLLTNGMLVSKKTCLEPLKR